MYKQKLEEQIKKLEALQDKCGICDIQEFVDLGRQILVAAKEFDEIENNQSQDMSVEVDGNKVREAIKSNSKK